ncbi:hypothetical protein TWF281_003889 [Arthrobotrys megalospora]
MHFSTLTGGSVVLVLATIADLASAHCVFADAYGNAAPGVRGWGLGFDSTTPRKGTYLYPQQRDVAVFSNKVVHDAWWKGYNPKGCGCSVTSVGQCYQKNEPKKWFPKYGITDAQRTWLFSQVTPAEGYIGVKKYADWLAWHEYTKKTRTCSVTGRKGLRTGFPKVTSGGELNIMNYQINIDGAGPFKCKIDFKGVGQSWTMDVPVTKNCPGDAHSLDWWGIQKPCWFKVKLPSNLNCQGVYGGKGEYKNICLVRCENNAANGPFGGCVPIQQLKPVKKIVTKKKTTTKPKATSKPKTPTKPPTQPKKVAPKVVTSVKKIYVTVTKSGVKVVSTVTKNVVVTKIVDPPPPEQTPDAEDDEEEEVEEEVDVYDIEEELKDPSQNDADKPAPKPAPATKTPTKEELEAALGGENFDEDTIKKLKEEKVSDEDKEALKKAAKDNDDTPEIGDVEDIPSYSY